MASLQARHSRACGAGKAWSPAGATDGCTCKPMYYVVVREGKALHREKAGKNLRAAEKQLRKVGVDVDDGSYEPLQSIRFAEWGDQWLKSLERKETTRDGYKSTVDHAKHVFAADKLVRRITPADVSALNVYLRDEKKLSDSTRAKHLRVLHACLESAVKHRYTKRNPVEALPDSERPHPIKTEAPYFDDDEIARLFQRIPELVATDVPNVYRYLFLTALKTGMRQGELLELRWGDVDLTEAVITVRRSITDGHISTPKNHRTREVHITSEVVEMLGRWWGLTGKRGEGELVFAGSTGGHLWPMTILRRELYPAMAATELPDGTKVEAIARASAEGKRTFHSLRHTFAKTALENGCEITWLSKHLGHSSLAVTSDVYGRHWEGKAKREQVKQMEGVFAV